MGTGTKCIGQSKMRKSGKPGWGLNSLHPGHVGKPFPLLITEVADLSFPTVTPLGRSELILRIRINSGAKGCQEHTFCIDWKLASIFLRKPKFPWSSSSPLGVKPP